MSEAELTVFGLRATCLTPVRCCSPANTGLTFVHLEGKPRDYVYTLRAWLRNLRSQEANLVALVGRDMVSDYVHNFKTCLDAYLAGALTLYRLVLERKGPVVG